MCPAKSRHVTVWASITKKRQSTRFVQQQASLCCTVRHPPHHLPLDSQSSGSWLWLWLCTGTTASVSHGWSTRTTGSSLLAVLVHRSRCLILDLDLEAAWRRVLAYMSYEGGTNV